jgi:tripartite-type tricarboxylate transporter receptor subunit TctC
MVNLLGRSIAGAVLVLSAAIVCAQTYPSRPVKVIVPFPAGSTPDIVGRTLAAGLQRTFGQPFVVENKAGAGGSIGADLVAKAAPDGYTLLIGTNGPVAINKLLYRRMSYDPEEDLAPVSLLASAPQMLVVHPSIGVHSFKEFLGYVRRNPGRLSYGSAGNGSASHLTMELLKSENRVFLVHIPYRGFPPAVTDMLSGNVQAMFAIIPGVLSHVKAGKLTGLAITGVRRSPLVPDIPSVADLGQPRLESLAWIGLLAPAGIAREVLSTLNTKTTQVMGAPEPVGALSRQGFDVIASTPQEFADWIAAERRKWAEVIRVSGATQD